MVDEFKKRYGVECFAALHHNKRKTNLHIHMIFAERKRLDQPKEKIATRNMFYDEQGRHVRTKKEILDGDGNIRKGCKIIKKGEVYERRIFTIKDSRFKQESFLDEAKVFYTDLINRMVIDDKDRLSIFDKNGPYLATKKVGKNNPKADEIKEDNEIRMEWNRAVDRAIISGVSETEIVELKKTEITDRVKKSVEQNGSKPELFGAIVRAAVVLLEKLIVKVMQKVMDFAEKVIGKADDAVKEIPKETESHAKEDSVFQPEKQLKKELSECMGIFKGGRRKELQQEIDSIDIQICNMKKRLSSIVREYKFDSIQAFYKEFEAAKSENLEYQAARAEYDKIYGDKAADSMGIRDRLRQKEQMAFCICPVSFVFRNVCTEVYEGYGDIMMTDWNTCLRKISEN